MPRSNLQFPGIVVAIKANFFEVEIHSSHIKGVSLDDRDFVSNKELVRLLCTSRNSLVYKGFSIKVGDNVVVEFIDIIERRGVITQVSSRENFLLRPSIANITKLFVAFSLDQPTFELDQASRFLVTAEQSGVEVGLLLTKSDLLLSSEVQRQILRITDWGYKPLSISVKTGDGLDSLVEQLASTRLSVICGPSGVGKTSLLNTLLPEQQLKVGALSLRLQRGKHTTRHVELFLLGQNSRVADTPGFNRPNIEVEPKKLSYLFPEIRSQTHKNSCKFRDCLHRDEPGCKINKNWERYILYRKYLDELITHQHSSLGG